MTFYLTKRANRAARAHVLRHCVEIRAKKKNIEAQRGSATQTGGPGGGGDGGRINLEQLSRVTEILAGLVV